MRITRACFAAIIIFTFKNHEAWCQFGSGDKWGIFTHYLADSAMNRFPAGFDSDEWNRRVDNFDVKRLAKQLSRTGCDYYFFTVGHSSGYYCSPNSVMDSILQRQPSHCSNRDLISDLAAGLKKYNIKLGVYITSSAPDGDSLAMRMLKWERGQFRNEEFQVMWERIIKEWAGRWGKNIFAWWIDAAYFPDSMYFTSDEPNQYSFARALRAGNPAVEICFNPGTRTQVKPFFKTETYSSGEMDYFLNIAGQRPLDNKWFNTREAMKGKHAFLLTFTGRWWGCGPPRLPDELITGYTKHAVSKGVKITWDVPVTEKGSMPRDSYRQVRKLRNIR
jgi:hypothetical protein